MRDDDREDAPLVTLTLLAERRDAVATNADRMLSLIRSLEAGRPASPATAEWFTAAFRRFLRSGDLTHELGLRGARGSHTTGHAMLRIVMDDGDE